MARANSGRLKKMHSAAYDRLRAHTANMTSDDFREHSRRVLKGLTPKQAAQGMREYGFTDDMIEKALKFIYDGEDSFDYQPRR